MSQRNIKRVYMIQEFQGRDGQSRRSWRPIGLAFVNRDGSLNVRLDAIPTGGQAIQIRDFEPAPASATGPTSEQPGRAAPSHAVHAAADELAALGAG